MNLGTTGMLLPRAADTSADHTHTSNSRHLHEQPRDLPGAFTHVFRRQGW